MTTWKTLDRFPAYEVSDEGQVRRAVGGRGAKAGKVLRWHTHTSTGYPDIRLRHEGKAVAIPVHRLVAWTFLGPRPEGLQIRHLDGNKMNASLSNLAYGTIEQNARDKVLHGNSSKGVRNPRAKLSEQDAKAVYQSKGVRNAELVAKQFGLSESTVYRIWSGTYWNHVTQEASNRAVDRAAA